MPGQRNRWHYCLKAVAVVALSVLATGLTQESFALDPPELIGAQWLVNQQNLDGSWGGTEEIKPLYTTNVVQALASVYQQNASYYRGIAWLENHNSPTVDYKSRRILALKTSGNVVADDVDYLRTSPDVPPAGSGGWGLTPAYSSAPLDTALVLQAFALVGETTNLQSALNFLKASQQTGTIKGWAVSQEPTSDPIVTAQVVLALSSYTVTDATLGPVINNAVSALQSMVGVGSSAMIKSHAVLALLRQSISSAYAQTLLNSLRATQSLTGPSSGSWGNDVPATAVAIRALAAAGGNGLAALSDLVFLPDVKLREAINLALGKNKADTLTRGELARLTSLNAAGIGIKDLRGLEWAINLRSADLRSNNIANIGALSALKSLTDIKLQGNQLSGTLDSDGDGALDAEEAFSGTHPFNSTSHPVFHVNGDVFNLGALVNTLPGNQLRDGWHTVWEDFDGDGDLDAIVYIQGFDENQTFGCPTCGPNYNGRTKGQLWVFERVGSSYVQRLLTAGEDRPNGDVSELFAFDYNNDGKRDLLMVLHPTATSDTANDTNNQHRDVVLFKNVSTTTLQFSDVTQIVGLPGPALTQNGTRSAALLDINRDGYLDIVTTTPPSLGKLWRFDPVTQTYQDVFVSTGLPLGLCCQLVTVDVDGDGLTDLVSHGGSSVFRLFRNNGSGGFLEMSNPSAVTLAPLDSLGSVTKVVVADYNRDGKQDLVVFETLTNSPSGTPAGGTVYLVKNLSGPGLFNVGLDTTVSGFESTGATVSDVSYGGTVGDIDNDGDLDPVIVDLQATEWTTIYRNNGDGSYTRLGALTNMRKNGNNAPYLGDLNGDGKLDLLLPSGLLGGYADYLYTNIETGNHYLIVNLTGKLSAVPPSSGKDAVGARVRVVAGGVTQWQEMQASFGRAHLLHFGLGTGTTADVTVFWPSGTAPTTLVGSLVDRVLSIVEP